MNSFVIRLAVIGIFCVKTVFGGVNEAKSHDTLTSSNYKETQRRELQIPVRDFTLTDQFGRKFRFQTLRGRVVVVAFGYTTCPDICPLTTAALRHVQTTLVPGEQESVFFVMITTDPEVDEPKVLRSYAKRFGIDFSNWVFLTGNEADLNPVWKNFGVRVLRKARGLIDHTLLTTVIDQTGKVRVAYYGAAPDSKLILEDVRRLLRWR
jgi:protein SCO1/2